MEIKKNPNVDVNRKRPAFLLMGLTASLALTLMAFEWKTLEDGELMDLGSVDDSFDEMIDVPPTEQPPPKQPIVQPQLIVVDDDEEIDEEIEIEIDVDLTEDQVIEDIVVEDMGDEEVEDAPFVIAEDPATFEGGNAAWLKFLRKNLKYPRSAQRMGIDGRVYLRFLVDVDGTLSNIEVLRGIGGGCDEEAVRVLKKSPKWKPGLQRGRPVKSPMSIAIVFTLN